MDSKQTKITADQVAPAPLEDRIKAHRDDISAKIDALAAALNKAKTDEGLVTNFMLRQNPQTQLYEVQRLVLVKEF